MLHVSPLPLSPKIHPPLPPVTPSELTGSTGFTSCSSVDTMPQGTEWNSGQTSTLWTQREKGLKLVKGNLSLEGNFWKSMKN